MNITRITDSLHNLFHAQGHRIVFWHDPDQEFMDLAPGLELDGVQVINLQEQSLLELKVRLELEDQDGKYLIYSAIPEPDPDKDWLLDIRLYSYSFYADKPSLILSELGLTHHHMREHLVRRRKFFDNKDRVSRLKKLITAEDREKDLDLKMLAVLTRAEHAGIFDILMKLFGEMCQGDACDFRTPPGAWSEIEKFGLEDFFWEEMARTFGYHVQDPGIPDLLIRILVTDLASNLRGKAPGSLQHFLLQGQGVGANVSVFAAQWRSHMGHYRQYGRISGQVAQELGLGDLLDRYDEQNLVDVMSFEAVERRIIRCLRDRIIRDGPDRQEDLKSLIQRRRDGHWATVQLETSEQGMSIYAVTYQALEAALDLFLLRREHDTGLSFPGAESMYQAYVGKLFRFDQLYRHFHEAADTVELAGWDVLKDVQESVESCYSGWYLDQLSMSWGSFLEGEQGLVNNWRLESAVNQQGFFSVMVKPILKHPKHKAYVIISDALRYEAAEELAGELNTKSRFRAELSTQLGVLPSYTALGMASLMPFDRYGYKEGTDQVLVDGLPCATLEQRNEILSRHKGVAVRAEDLLAMSKDQGRELVRPWRVIYIYHNQIDATGDTAATEKKTFAAVRKTISELASLVRFVVNSLNGSNVLVTADHGFLYRDVAPTHLEKSSISHKPEGAVKAKKRYILGYNLGRAGNALHGSTRKTAGTSDDMEFWIPRGVTRFHFSGGARFTHGGAMPQEVVVPIIKVKELDTRAAAMDAVKKVGVSLLGSNRKIVNTIHRFEFIQTEKVSQRMLPRTLVVSIRDGDELISDEQTVTFDSSSDSMEERKRSVRLMLKKGDYNSTKDYSLVLRDPETRIEYDRIPVNIDLAFIDDF